MECGKLMSKTDCKRMAESVQFFRCLRVCTVSKDTLFIRIDRFQQLANLSKTGRVKRENIKANHSNKFFSH